MSKSDLADELSLIAYDFGRLIEAKDEKDTNGESELYQELKRNAWGNARVALYHLRRVIKDL